MEDELFTTLSPSALIKKIKISIALTGLSMKL